MRKAVFLVLIFFISVMAPLASSATTETQFKGGATSYTHTFNGQGNGSAGVITFPFGAEVTSAQFNFLGEASTTTWSNFTNNNDFGGVGTGQWSSKQTGSFQYGTRTNLETANDEISLRGNPTNNVANFRNSNELSAANSATINATGQFVALGDQGYTSVTKQFNDLSVSSSASWNYRGIVVPVSEHEIHATRYSSTSMYTAPSIQRINATTGALLGSASISTSGCTSSVSSYWYDAAVDPNGNIWTVSYSYYYLTKWTLNAAKTQWQCSSYTSYGYPYYLTGVDFDDDTGKMFVSYYDSSTYPTYNRYLMEVNPSNPSSINSTWSIGSAADYNYKTTSTSGNPNSGLVVDLPRVILNEYNVQGSRHHHFSMNGFSLTKMGMQEMPNGGHYGITQIDDEGKIYYSCYHTSYCNTVARKIHMWGDGGVTDSRTPTSTSTTVYGQTTTATRSVDQIKLESAIGYMPTGTSIDIDVSNDDGVTWKSIRCWFNQDVRKQWQQNHLASNAQWNFYRYPNSRSSHRPIHNKLLQQRKFLRAFKLQQSIPIVRCCDRSLQRNHSSKHLHQRTTRRKYLEPLQQRFDLLWTIRIDQGLHHAELRIFVPTCFVLNEQLCLHARVGRHPSRIAQQRSRKPRI